MDYDNKTKDAMREAEIDRLQNQQLNLLHQLAGMNIMNNIITQTGFIPTPVQPQWGYCPYYNYNPFSPNPYMQSQSFCNCKNDAPPEYGDPNIIDVEGRIIDD